MMKTRCDLFRLLWSETFSQLQSFLSPAVNIKFLLHTILHKLIPLVFVLVAPFLFSCSTLLKEFTTAGDSLHLVDLRWMK